VPALAVVGPPRHARNATTKAARDFERLRNVLLRSLCVMCGFVGDLDDLREPFVIRAGRSDARESGLAVKGEPFRMVSADAVRCDD
jgi:hypothetical protein